MGLIKNDKSTTDLNTELTCLCDQLIVTNGALTLFKCHTRHGKLHRTLRRMVKAWQENFVVT